MEIESIYGSILKVTEGDSLRGADLRRADLSEADLRGADLREADLREADLSRADLRGANLCEADLREVVFNELTFGLTINCPEEGAFMAYKKCRGKIVKLLIPENALRSSATSYKCRASKAVCLEIDGGLRAINSGRDHDFIYEVGKEVEVDDFDTNRWNECSTGIHFFMNRAMAEQWNG